MDPAVRPARTATAGLRRDALVLGAALAVAAVTMTIAVPLLGATQDALWSAPPDWWDTSSVVTASGLARVLAGVTIVTWLAAEAVFSRTSGDSWWRPTPAKALAAGGLLIGAWVAAAYAHVMSPCLYDPSCFPIPWPGPRVPIFFPHPPVDLAVAPELWPAPVEHLDVDAAVGPVLILLALAVGLYGARSTASRTLRRAQASPLATRTAAALTGAFAVLGVAGVVALTISAADPDVAPRYTPVVDLGLWGVLGAVVVGFLVSGGRRADAALLVGVVLVQQWGAVELWLSGESYAYLGQAVGAVGATVVATTWHRLAAALDALIGSQ